MLETLAWGVYRRIGKGSGARRIGVVPLFDARVDVSHLPGIADPAGATVERALPALGYTNVTQVHIGKTIRLIVDAADMSAARQRWSEMLRRLLANPVIEAYEITISTAHAVDLGDAVTVRIGVVQFPGHLVSSTSCSPSSNSVAGVPSCCGTATTPRTASTRSSCPAASRTATTCERVP